LRCQEIIEWESCRRITLRAAAAPGPYNGTQRGHNEAGHLRKPEPGQDLHQSEPSGLRAEGSHGADRIEGDHAPTTYAFAKIKDELVLRHRNNGKSHIKAVFYEDDRRIDR